MAGARILVVEDDRLLTAEIQRMLVNLGYEVTATAASGEEAIARAAETLPDLVMMDIVLKGNLDGVRAAEHINTRLDIPVVYLSAHSDETTLHRAKITEPYGYIVKPFEERELHTNIEVALYRHRTEKQLREKRTSLQSALEKATIEKSKSDAIIEAIGDGFSIQDTDFRLLYMNRTAREMFGDRVGDYCYQVFEQRDIVCPDCPLAASYADGKIHRVERSNPTRTLHVEITASPVRDAAGAIIGGIELVRDITRQKLDEEALRESEERYRNLIENAHDMIQSVDAEGKFIFVNAAWLKTLGYTEDDLRRMTLFDVIHPDCRQHCSDIFRKVLGGDPTNNIVATFIAKDGRPVHVEGNVNIRSAGGEVIATQGIFRDVTERVKAEVEREKLEAQLLHAQKMEAIGTLTGGIAHEFNNIMTAIIGYGEFVQEGIADDSPLRPYTNSLLASAMRATQLTQSLLAYSRKQIMNPRPLNLGETVQNVGRLLSKLIGENRELRLRLGDEQAGIMADPGQIEQVLINLATNARDAMPGGGTLTIATSRSLLGTEYMMSHGYASPGMYAEISMTDTGVGMDERTRERIFEPFFTTKELGKGTGLGLAMVYGIIKQHDGYIDVDSEPGKGTTFRIYLPLTEAEGGERKSAEALPMRQGSETVLVAEDDVAVRNLTREVLERAGYRVIVAADGEEAVRKFLENREAVALLVFDMVMPKKSGEDAYREIRKVRADMKVMFMSGYSPDLLQRDGIIEQGMNFFPKPISPGDLARRVREILDGQPR
jgi:PAS domain S-box-containing protein